MYNSSSSLSPGALKVSTHTNSRENIFPPPIRLNSRIQGLWNRVLDECAEKQKKSSSGASSHAPSGVVSAGDDSRGETSEESHGEGSSSAESETAEPEATTGELAQVLGVHGTGNVAPTGAEGGDAGPDQDSNTPIGKGKADGALGRTALERPAQEAGSTARDPVSLGRVLEETAREHIASFSTEELEVWNWHRGNLEISCGAVSVTQELHR